MQLYLRVTTIIIGLVSCLVFPLPSVANGAEKPSETGSGGLTQASARLCKIKPGNPSHVLPLTVKEEGGGGTGGGET